MPPGDHLRAWSLNALVSAAALVCVSAALEAGVRVFAPQTRYPHPQGLYTPLSGGGYRNASHFAAVWTTEISTAHVRTNSLGFRDREFGPKSPGTTRILVLGDSFTFAPEVEAEDTFPRVLEGLLNGTAGTGAYEVINAGVDGYGTVDELRLLQEVGLALAPDVVIVAFYNNDIKDAVRETRTVQYGYLADGAGPVDEPSAHYSHAYALVQKRVQAFIDAKIKPHRTLAVYRKAYSDQQEEGWRRTQAAFVELFGVCAAQGIRPLVVIISNGRQLDVSLFRKYRIAFDEYDFLKPNRLVADLCAEHGVAVLDLLEPFRAAAVEEPLYYLTAGHFTPAGHQVAARAIAAFLSANPAAGGAFGRQARALLPPG